MDVPTSNLSFNTIGTLLGRRNDDSVHLVDYIPPGGILSGDINYTINEEAQNVKGVGILRNKGRIVLSNVQSTPLSDTSVRVSWGGQKFSFARIEWSGGSSNIPYGIFTFDISGLTANQQNSISVEPIKNSGNTIPNRRISTNAITLPSIPSIVTTSNISDTSVTVNWSGGIYSYVKVSWSAGVSSNIMAGTSTFVATGLTQNTSYIFTVTPYNSANIAGTAKQSSSVVTNSSGISSTSFELSIPSINTTPWYIDASNNVNISGNGRKLTFVMEYPTDIFSDANGPYSALKDTFSGLYLRHSGFILKLSAFQANNYDFAFKFINVSDNSYKIYNPYSSTYVGYNGTYVAIESDTLSTATVINTNVNLMNMLPPSSLTPSATSFVVGDRTYTWGIQNQYGTHTASYLFDGNTSTTLSFDTFSNVSPYSYNGVRQLNGISGVFSSISTSGTAFICIGYSYTIVENNYGPKSMAIIASNDNITYTTITTLINISNTSQRVTWNTTTPYKNWYVLFTSSNGPNTISLNENKFWVI